ncbi:hypothetical protein [Paenisporosarcina sp.]|uniref:hypothetical protein n=1 Tax=Paenisporosarcina sp. TaxID=1932001 RepID=UPI003C718731
MLYIKNQKGYILLIVLMLVMVFSVLGISLMSLNITSAKQFDNKEKNVQARHAAEMGALHYKAQVANEWSATISKMKAEIKTFNDLPNNSKSQKKNAYVNSIKSLNVDFCEKINMLSLQTDEYIVNKPSTAQLCNYNPSNQTEWEFTVTSVNKLSPSSRPVKISATVKVRPPILTVSESKIEIPLVVNGPQNKKQFKDANNKYNGKNVIDENVFIGNFDTATKEMLTFNKDFYATDSFSLQPHSCVIVKGNFKVDNDLRTKNNATLFIFGDADLPADFQYHNNHGGIYVSGNLFFDGVFQSTKPHMGLDLTKNPGGCSVPSGFNIKNPTEFQDDPDLIVTYN